MTQDEIIEMAKEAGFPIFGTKVVANDPMQQMLADAVTQHYHDSAIQFAKLVAAKEREACAKICDSFQARDVGMQPAECAGAIRARGEA
jgi:hypothetical protein